MPTIKQYEHSGNPPIPDELATCIAFLQAAKLRAEAHICNPFTDTSWLEEPEQKLIDQDLRNWHKVKRLSSATLH